MQTSPKSVANAAALVLPAILDLAQADNLQATLLAGLERDESALSLDGSAVTIVSTACLQVLAAAALASAANGRHFALAPSPVLAAASNDLGLSPTLGLGAA